MTYRTTQGAPVYPLLIPDTIMDLASSFEYRTQN